MNHANLNIVGLALGTLGNIASVEVARDLTDEVEKLLEHSSPYIRKKVLQQLPINPGRELTFKSGSSLCNPHHS